MDIVLFNVLFSGVRVPTYRPLTRVCEQRE